MTGPEGDPNFEFDERDVNAPDLNDELAELALLLAAKDDAKKRAEAADRAYKDHRAACYERMEDEQVQSVRVGGKLFVRNEPTWYATVQDRAQLQAWLRENAPAVLITTEQRALLNKLVQACFEDGREFPPGLGAYPQKVVAVRK